MASVLVVDDEPNIRRMVAALLAAEGYDVREAADGVSAIAAAADEPDVVLLDLMMPGAVDGMATLGKLRELHPDLPVIMMSGRAALADAVRATKLGAFNFLEKPLTPESVVLSTAAAAELGRTRRAARALRDELGLGEMIGDSAALHAVRALIARVASSDVRVLITGESGTGKELVAAAIHDASDRSDQPFVRVNCAAIPRDLVESEMFGHEKGAFTGATQTRVGRFELAHGGTLLLDEVGDLSAEAQAKLLRAIELGEIQRVGGARSIRVDVRIVAATNQDLARAVEAGRFREDLYFRLNVIPIALPPLRERRDDIPLLVRHFAERHRRATGRTTEWADDAIRALRDYSWPGNVRELANVVERFSILHPGTTIRAEHLREVLPGDHLQQESAVPMAHASLSDALDRYERSLIEHALDGARGNVAEAARRLQTDRPNLYRRMKRLGIAALFACALVGGAGAAGAQSDTVGIRNDTVVIVFVDTVAAVPDPLRTARRSRLVISSGRTYNRVEGLPLHFGPVFADSGGAMRFSVEAFGIIRSAQRFHWDSRNLGHLLRLEARGVRQRTLGITLASYDIVDAVEQWQIPQGEAAIAAFLFRRDYRDYYGRHGGSVTATAYAGARRTASLSFADERWSSLAERDVFSLIRNSRDWRANPAMDDGHARLLTLRGMLDTRNDVRQPSAGSWAVLEYERGDARLTALGATSSTARAAVPLRSRYGRFFMDVRRYNRVSPQTQLNVRLVAGGWLHGDELPLQRRFSVGGPGTIPGLSFRESPTPDVTTCRGSDPVPGDPAACERVLLLQAEYRDELPFRPGTIFGGTPIRIRSAALTLRPVLVAFADIGRGWLLPPRGGWRVPPLRTFQTDVGVGIDLGLFGVYVAKSVSEEREPAKLIVRARGRL